MTANVFFFKLEQLLKEELEPRIEKLRDEQSQYEEFQKIVRDIDHLTHIHVSYMYLRYKKAIENCDKNLEEATAFIEQSHQKIKNNEEETERIEEECKEMQERIDNEAGGTLSELEKELAVKSKAEATALGAKKSAASEIETEKRKLKTLQKNLGKDEDALKTKETRMNEVGSLFENLKKADENDREAFAEAQKRFQALSAGLDVNEDGQTASLQEQLISEFRRSTTRTIVVIGICDFSIENENNGSQDNHQAERNGTETRDKAAE